MDKGNDDTQTEGNRGSEDEVNAALKATFDWGLSTKTCFCPTPAPS